MTYLWTAAHESLRLSWPGALADRPQRASRPLPCCWRRVFCGHWFHYDCLRVWMTEPPFGKVTAACRGAFGVWRLLCVRPTARWDECGLPRCHPSGCDGQLPLGGWGRVGPAFLRLPGVPERVTERHLLVRARRGECDVSADVTRKGDRISTWRTRTRGLTTAAHDDARSVEKHGFTGRIAGGSFRGGVPGPDAFAQPGSGVDRLDCVRAVRYYVLHVARPLELGTGQDCPRCGRRVYHPDWPQTRQQLEKAWANRQAKQREIGEVRDFFTVDARFQTDNMGDDFSAFS